MNSHNPTSNVRKTVLAAVAVLAAIFLTSVANVPTASANNVVTAQSGVTAPASVPTPNCRREAGNGNWGSLLIDLGLPTINGANTTRNSGDITYVAYAPFIFDANTGRFSHFMYTSSFTRVSETQAATYRTAPYPTYYASLRGNTRIGYQFYWVDSTGNRIIGSRTISMTNYRSLNWRNVFGGNLTSCYLTAHLASNYAAPSQSTPGVSNAQALKIPSRNLKLPNGKTIRVD